MPEDVYGSAPQQQPLEEAEPVGAQHDQVGVPILSFFENLMAGPTLTHPARGGNARGSGHLFEQTLHLSAALPSVLLLVECRRLHQHGRQWLLDVKRAHLGAVRQSDRGRGFEHDLGLGRKVERRQDASERLAPCLYSDEHRTMCEADHPLGGGAHEETGQCSPRVCADDYEIGALLLRRRADHWRRRATAHMYRRMAGTRLFSLRARPLTGFLDESLLVARWLHPGRRVGFGEDKRIDNAQDVESCAGPAGEGRASDDRRGSMLGAVGRCKNALDR